MIEVINRCDKTTVVWSYYYLSKVAKIWVGGGGGIELLHNIREPTIGFDVAPILLCDSIIV